MEDREKMLRAFFLKAVYDLPTTKGLIENLKTNPSLRRLCGREYRGEVPSEATFSGAFGIFAREKVCDAIHAAVVRENYTGKWVGHSGIDSTAIPGRKKACRKNTPKTRLQKKRGRKSKAEKSAPAEPEIAAVRTRRPESPSDRTLPENLPVCRKAAAGAENATAKGKTPAGAAASSVSQPGMAEFHRLHADSACDAEEIKAVSEKMGHVPIIDPNFRQGGTIELPPARKVRYRERSTVERVNSDLKDNYGVRHVRVKGHWKVLCHLTFGVIAITVKQLFNMLEWIYSGSIEN